jgi:hypothetical protein
LELRIPKGLAAKWSELRILKRLRAIPREEEIDSKRVREIAEINSGTPRWQPIAGGSI